MTGSIGPKDPSSSPLHTPRPLKLGSMVSSGGTHTVSSEASPSSPRTISIASRIFSAFSFASTPSSPMSSRSVTPDRALSPRDMPSPIGSPLPKAEDIQVLTTKGAFSLEKMPITAKNADEYSERIRAMFPEKGDCVQFNIQDFDIATLHSGKYPESPEIALQSVDKFSKQIGKDLQRDMLLTVNDESFKKDQLKGKTASEAAPLVTEFLNPKIEKLSILNQQRLVNCLSQSLQSTAQSLASLIFNSSYNLSPEKQAPTPLVADKILSGLPLEIGQGNWSKDIGSEMPFIARVNRSGNWSIESSMQITVAVPKGQSLHFDVKTKVLDIADGQTVVTITRK